MSSTSYVRFPPNRPIALVPTEPGWARTVGLSLYTATQPRALLAQHAIWLGTRLFGARALPGPRTSWEPPLPAPSFAGLREQWRALLGPAGEAFAIYERPQAHRAGSSVTLLLCSRSGSLLVRIRADAESLQQERRFSAAAAAHPARSFRVPQLAGHGELDGWHWTAYRAISERPHRPVHHLGPGGYAEITELVERVLPRAGVPAHWRGAHRDLTPWNLRRGAGSVWLIDWEDAGYAPPDADEVYLRAVRAAGRRGPVRAGAGPADTDEARAYWIEQLDRRAEAGSDLELIERIQRALGR